MTTPLTTLEPLMMNEKFSRNVGILSEAEMTRLNDTRIAIAGCGCIGGFAAELFARLGVGHLRIADPDVFDLSNINRQCMATHSTVGQHKATVLSRHLLAINPDLDIDTWPVAVDESKF